MGSERGIFGFSPAETLAYALAPLAERAQLGQFLQVSLDVRYLALHLLQALVLRDAFSEALARRFQLFHRKIHLCGVEHARFPKQRSDALVVLLLLPSHALLGGLRSRDVLLRSRARASQLEQALEVLVQSLDLHRRGFGVRAPGLGEERAEEVSFLLQFPLVFVKSGSFKKQRLQLRRHVFQPRASVHQGFP
jgi:hypothetical protein